MPSLLTPTGNIDAAACRALALSRCAFARTLPRYEEILAGTLEVVHEQARQEKKRRGMSPESVEVLNLQDRLAHTDYLPFAEAEEVRPKLLKQLAEAKAAAQAPRFLQAAE